MGRTIPTQKPERARRWLTAKVDAGEGTAGLAAVLAKLHRDTGRPTQAVFYLIYARALAAVDGPSCADRTAAFEKRRNLVMHYDDLDSAFRALPAAERAALVERALALEAATWPTRPRRRRPRCGGAGPVGHATHRPRDPNHVPSFRSVEARTRDRAEIVPHLGDSLFQMARTPRAQT